MTQPSEHPRPDSDHRTGHPRGVRTAGCFLVFRNGLKRRRCPQNFPERKRLEDTHQSTNFLNVNDTKSPQVVGGQRPANPLLVPLCCIQQDLHLDSLPQDGGARQRCHFRSRRRGRSRAALPSGSLTEVPSGVCLGDAHRWVPKYKLPTEANPRRNGMKDPQHRRTAGRPHNRSPFRSNWCVRSGLGPRMVSWVSH